MKIGQPSDNPIPVNTTASPVSPKGGQNASSTANAAAAKSTQSAGVAVTVSTLARTMSAAKSGETADIDTAKVESVRSAIQQGTYVVNPAAIADKLLANAQEMLDRTRG
ncbi:flagellar biosynthesis anti-sigma factor FlgM [Rhodoferax sp. UBA5149]|uniref:flagellar biosynthesis anti-sigma factor FlgM n=1 Tax=Rhodoferax sp. UBA5149 TaxID=1947379 RepID=UPI0025E9C10A|nr:flagellar biosynthesis anti-sigma factor FlgM [Rhodoferax sp. UBA5149]